MSRIWKHCWLLGPALLLGACGSDDDAVSGNGSESAAEEQAAATQRVVPVQSIGNLEIGRTRDGILIATQGTAPSLGYSLPTLRPRRGGQPASDGFIEFDFVATEPAPELNFPVGTTRTRALRADRPVNLDALRGARGVRVLTATNAMQVNFGADE